MNDEIEEKALLRSRPLPSVSNEGEQNTGSGRELQEIAPRCIDLGSCS